MAEVWDIYERETEPASLRPLGGGWRLKVQTSRDEQRERDALGIGSGHHQPDRPISPPAPSDKRPSRR